MKLIIPASTVCQNLVTGYSSPSSHFLTPTEALVVRVTTKG